MIGHNRRLDGARSQAAQRHLPRSCSGKAALWLSGMPTAENVKGFPRVGLQINCTEKTSPEYIKYQPRTSGHNGASCSQEPLRSTLRRAGSCGTSYDGAERGHAHPLQSGPTPRSGSSSEAHALPEPREVNSSLHQNLERCRHVEMGRMLKEAEQGCRRRRGSSRLRDWLYDAQAKQVPIKQQSRISGYRSSTHSNALLHVIEEVERSATSLQTATACRHQQRIEASLHKDRLETENALETMAWQKT